MAVIFMVAAGLYVGESWLTNVVAGELDHLAIETAIIQLTNAERAEAGLDPLRYNARVSEIARAHSENMARTDTYAHYINGQGPSDRALRADHPCGLGENIHMVRRSGFSDSEDMAQEMVEDWMDSPGHKRNILDSTSLRLGVGVFVDEGLKDIWVYSTQNFSPC